MNGRMVCAAIAAVAATAWSAESPRGLNERLVVCADIAETAPRLACFDREVAPLRAAARGQGAVVATPSPAPVVPPRPALDEEQLRRSGAEVAAQDASETVQARITELRQLGADVYLVSLDNGQTWRHDNAALGAYLRVGDAVTISKGKLGTYRLVRDAGKAKDWIRIARVR
jgi:hypothetical protein